ncbi:MAG: RNA 2',3'-cyclic phosphodiesterase [Nanoarchaeota archaeon]
MRCFLGIDVGAYRKAFEKIDVPLQESVQPVKNYHITLNFWPDLDERTRTQVSTRIVTFNHAPFDVQLDTIMAFPSVQAPELYALSTSDPHGLVALRSALQHHIGVKFSDHFRPHITLARKEKVTPGSCAEQVARITPLTITIDSVALFESRPEQGMNTYFSQVTYFS